MTTTDKRKVFESLAQLLEDAPEYGEVGILCRLHAGSVVLVERRNTESVKLETAGCRR